MFQINTLALITLFVLIVIYFNFVRESYETVFIKSDIDNNTYKIQKGNSKSSYFLKESANTLGLINIRIENLIKHLEDNFKSSDYYYFIKMLKKNYNSSILEEASIDKRYTTYTIDKKSLHVCLRTRDEHEELYDINLLMYILLHELSHICNYSKSGYPIHGHGLEFQMIFKFLVKEAIKIGVYKYVDYRINNTNYCGILINSSII